MSALRNAYYAIHKLLPIDFLHIKRVWRKKMKKLSCLLLALVMVFSVAGSALAFTLSGGYSDGSLDVSASEAAYYEVTIDGSKAGVVNGGTDFSYSGKLVKDNGAHSVMFHKPDTGEYQTLNFTVTDGNDPQPSVDPTVEPTERPIVGSPKITYVGYSNDGSLNYTVASLPSYCEVRVDGAKIAGISEDGSYPINKALSHGEHTLDVYCPDNASEDSKTFMAHTYATLPAVEGTCTETGLTEGLKCSVCGNVLKEQEVVPAKGHTPAEAVKENEVEPTCSVEGSYDEVVYCSVCEEELSRETKTVEKLAHTPEVVPGKEATCSEEGLTDGEKCSVCGEVLKEQEPIEKLAHTPEVIPGTEATCTEAGLTDGEKCSVCGEVLKAQEEIPAKGHTAEEIPAKPATCTESGLTAGSKCSVCGEILEAQAETAPLGHRWKETGREDGRIYYMCVNCGMEKSEADPNASAKEEGYGDIVLDANKAVVPYTAEADAENEKLLVITADLSDENLTSEKGLYLSEETIAKMQENGFEAVEFVNGDAVIVIDLAKLDTVEFEEEVADPKTLVFSTDPTENGTMIMVEADGEEQIPAKRFDCVTFKAEKEDLRIVQNGLY